MLHEQYKLLAEQLRLLHKSDIWGFSVNLEQNIFGASYDACISIYNFLLRQEPVAMPLSKCIECYNSFSNEKFTCLERIADDYNITMSRAINVLIKGYLLTTQQGFISKARVRRIRKDPTVLGDSLLKRLIEEFKEREVETSIPALYGDKCERDLQNCLSIQQILFKSEKNLHGQIKTPDILLLEDVYYGGVKINWIDSKAGYGVPTLLVENTQFITYYNMYGTGLVVYYAGFVEDLATDERYVVVDHLPQFEKF
ncbi:hypothetical protein PCE1_002645 [Barthelona sp. PCE]